MNLFYCVNILQMFSEEALISMANGSFKPINQLVRGELIINKFGKRTTVLQLKTHEKEESMRIQLDNGTGTFYISPNTIVLGYYRTPELTLKSEYCTISHLHQNKGYLKSGLKLFSPESDVQIESYISSEPRTLYSLITSDNSKSYKVNKIIVSNQPSHPS